MIRFASTLDSTIESVDTAEESLRHFCAKTGFEESDVFFIALAVREILVNAVKHGNRLDPGKKVEMQLSADETGVTIGIRDEGEGFCPESVPDPRLAENLALPSGRGIVIARGLMDDFQIESGATGTLVRMSKLLRKPS